MCFLWGEPRRKLSFSTVLICFLTPCCLTQGQVKRMFLFTEGILHSSSTVVSFSICFNPVLSFLSFCPELTCHLVVFQEDMTSDFDSNLPTLTNTSSYCLSRPSSPLFTQTRLFFSSSSVSLYLCTVGGRQRKPHGSAIGMRRRRQAERDTEKQ